MRLFRLLLVAVLVVSATTGCQAAGKAGDTLKQSMGTTASGKSTNPALSLEEAQSIALEHAGFAADQVTALHTSYEVEHGVPQYDVEFRRGSLEYDYEIHGDTGEILSYSMDD